MSEVPQTMADLMDSVRAMQRAHPDRDFIVLSNGVSRNMHLQLSRALAIKQDKKPNCTLFLTTLGGDADGGYRIARCLRHHYDHLRIAVPSQCKSAGTLIAIAANELAIGDLGELGPLDIQVMKGTELRERSSGLDIMQALQAVTKHTHSSFHQLLSEIRDLGLATKLSADFAAQVSAGMSAPLFSQIDPLRMGEMQRAISVAIEYGKRLDRYGNNLKPDALDKLVEAYPAHSFVIDRKEATELFNNVYHLSDAENAFATDWWFAVGSQGTFNPEIFPDPLNDPRANDETLPPTIHDGDRVENLDTTEPEHREGGLPHGQDNEPPNDQGLRVVQGGGAG